MTSTASTSTTPSPFNSRSRRMGVRQKHHCFPMVSIFCFSALLMGGCATSSRVMVGESRPPIDPASVKLYLTPPEHYDEVAVITADSDGSWTFSQQAKMEVVIERLKIEAAAVGANGILLRDINDRSEDPVIITDEHDGWSTGFGISEQEKTAWAVAIYVPEEGAESLFSFLGKNSPWSQNYTASVE